MIKLSFIRAYIPVFGIFRSPLYDEAFSVAVTCFVVFILFGYVRWIFNKLISRAPSSVPAKLVRCHFCENTNLDAVVDPVTDLCRSCGQPNAFESDGDYSRPLPELYHAQMNMKSSCMTPNSKRGLPTSISPNPVAAPGNVLCARCMDNQEKIVAMRAGFVSSSGDETIWDREFAAYERQLQKEFPLCHACQIRVTQFVGEQDRQIAATVASTTSAGTQNRLFMAKHSCNPSQGDGDVFVPLPWVHRRKQIIIMFTLLSAVFPVCCGPFDLRIFWPLRFFTNFLAFGLAVASTIMLPYRRMTPLAILALGFFVFIDLLAVFCNLKFVSAESLSPYLQPVAHFQSVITQYCPFAVSFFAFLNAISFLPNDKRSSANGAFRRQNSATTYNGSPTASEPYVQSLLAETVAYKRRSAGAAIPWRAYSTTKSVYMRGDISPYSSVSVSPRVSRSRPISSSLAVHLSIAAVALAALVAYAFYVL